MKRLTIIILNHNTLRLVEAALQSVHEQRQKDWEVIVVDNASRDGSISSLRKYFPWVQLVKADRNLGFAGGNNLGMKKADSQYIMLLNSDALFTHKGTLVTLLEYMDQHADVGVITPKVVLAHGQLDRASHRGFPTPWSAFTYFSGLEKLFGAIPLLSRVFGRYHMTWKSMATPHEIDACTGAAMIVRTKALDQVGLLDESFFMYGEDLDWCYRFKQERWKVVFHPGFEVLHLKHQSGLKKEGVSHEIAATRRQTRGHFFDTMSLFYQKHYARKYPAIVTKFVQFGISIIRSVKGA